jgi:hypothetical protein
MLDGITTEIKINGKIKKAESDKRRNWWLSAEHEELGSRGGRPSEEREIGQMKLIKKQKPLDSYDTLGVLHFGFVRHTQCSPFWIHTARCQYPISWFQIPEHVTVRSDTRHPSLADPLYLLKTLDCSLCACFNSV